MARSHFDAVLRLLLRWDLEASLGGVGMGLWVLSTTVPATSLSWATSLPGAFPEHPHF